jgi:hypothetical protein
MKLFSFQKPALKVINPETGRHINVNGQTAKSIKRRYGGAMRWIYNKLSGNVKELKQDKSEGIKNNKLKKNSKLIGKILLSLGIICFFLYGLIKIAKEQDKHVVDASTDTIKDQNAGGLGTGLKQFFKTGDSGHQTGNILIWVVVIISIIIGYLGVKAYVEHKLEKEDLKIKLDRTERRKIRNSLFWFDFDKNTKNYYNIQFLENDDTFFVEKEFMTINELENVSSCPGNNFDKGNKPLKKEHYDCEGAAIYEILQEYETLEIREDNGVGWIKINTGTEKEPIWELDRKSIYKDKIQRKLWILKEDDKYNAINKKGGKKKEVKKENLKTVDKKFKNVNCNISTQKYKKMCSVTLHFMEQVKKFINDSEIDKDSNIYTVIVPYYHQIIMKNTSILLKCKEKILKRKSVTKEMNKDIVDFISYNVEYLKVYMSFQK